VRGILLVLGQGFWQKDEVLTPFSTGGNPENTRIRRNYSAYAARRPGIQACKSQSADGAGPPMLNSARRHFTSPRRGRRVEWSDSRRGSERLHFRARRICRRCASDASQESVGDPGSIDVTTTDNPFVIDSVERCKGRSGIIESGKLVWRDKEETMSRA